MPVERREARNVAQCQGPPQVCTDGPFRGYRRLHWIQRAASRNAKQRFCALSHHLSEENLRRAFHELKGSKASGMDHVTKHAYRRNLNDNLRQLHQRLRGGGWRPRPSRQVLIPKAQGGTRPLAIGCVEDKIVQSLVARILEAIYEPSFYRHSYGFRRGKSAHQAIRRLHKVIRERRSDCVVVEVDIEKFFDSMDHGWLVERLQEKIGDAHFIRLIRRMLRNSVLGHDGQVRINECGTPQGSPVSPILANIYLHYLLDEWFRQNYSARGQMIRYADDVTFVFRDMKTAQAFQADLIQRMQEGGLTINLDKSKIVPFDDKAPQGNVNLLGFTFYWGRNRQRKRMLKVKTASKSLSRSMKAFTDWIKRYRNRWPLKRLWRMAALKLRGHYNYFAVSSNQRRVSHFYYVCINSLFKWLNRRSQKRSFTWEKFKRRLFFNPLPRPPLGFELIDITQEHGTVWKHKPRSRMRKLRTYGSVRSSGQKPVFT